MNFNPNSDLQYNSKLFFESLNSSTSSSVPPSSQSPILHTHDNSFSIEKIKQELLKEKQNNNLLENLCNHYKTKIDSVLKENNDWRNKYLTSEHEKSQVR